MWLWDSEPHCRTTMFLLAVRYRKISLYRIQKTVQPTWEPIKANKKLPLYHMTKPALYWLSKPQVDKVALHLDKWVGFQSSTKKEKLLKPSLSIWGGKCGPLGLRLSQGSTQTEAAYLLTICYESSPPLGSLKDWGFLTDWVCLLDCGWVTTASLSLKIYDKTYSISLQNQTY